MGLLATKTYSYTPNINLTKIEPLKPSRSGDISLLVLKFLKEAVKQPYCLAKNIHHQTVRILPAIF